MARVRPSDPESASHPSDPDGDARETEAPESSSSAASTPAIPKPPQIPRESAPDLGVTEDRKALEQAEDRIKALTSRAVGLRSRLEETEKKLADRDTELGQLRAQHESLRSLVAARADRIRELEQQVAERDAALAEARDHDGRTEEEALRERVAELEAALLASEQRVAEREAALREKEGETRDTAALRERIATLEATLAELGKQGGQAGGPDDLRAIYGIGPKMEARLVELGITRYEQIAAWSDADVADFAAKLKIHAKRIRNADWVGSARALAERRAPSSNEEPPSPPADSGSGEAPSAVADAPADRADDPEAVSESSTPAPPEGTEAPEPTARESEGGTGTPDPSYERGVEPETPEPSDEGGAEPETPERDPARSSSRGSSRRSSPPFPRDSEPPTKSVPPPDVDGVDDAW